VLLHLLHLHRHERVDQQHVGQTDSWRGRDPNGGVPDLQPIQADGIIGLLRCFKLHHAHHLCCPLPHHLCVQHCATHLPKQQLECLW
jgi:hypothetical protein